MKRSRILSLVLALALSFSMLGMLSACGDQTSEPTDSIKIGVITPLTGDVAVYGIAVQNAVQLYTDKINEAGGINGKQVDLIIYDDKGSATEALNAYNRLVSSDKVVAIIGPTTSDPTFGVAQNSVEDNIPCITGTATHPDVTTYGNNFFRACYTDPTQGGTVANFAKDELNATTAAIIYNSSDPYSTGLKDAFEATAEENGLTIVATEGYSKGDQDFNAQLTTIMNRDPDVLFIPDYYNNAYMICTQARRAGFTGTFLGVDGTDGVLEIEGADVSVFEGMCYPNHYFSGDPDELVQTFCSDYEAAYGRVPNALAAVGYDAAMILYDSIARAEAAGTTIDNSPEARQAIIDAMEQTDLDCVTGHITFDENHNPIKPVTIIEIVNGQTTFKGRY